MGTGVRKAEAEKVKSLSWKRQKPAFQKLLSRQILLAGTLLGMLKNTSTQHEAALHRSNCARGGDEHAYRPKTDH